MYDLPAYAEPQIRPSRTPSPFREGSPPPDSCFSVVDLIVTKLPCKGAGYASRHLRAVIGEYSQQHPSERLPPVRVIDVDDRNVIDYAFVSLDPSITREPRPDLLDNIRRMLVSQGFHADWKVAKGPDRTRRVHFQMETYSQAEAIQPKLNRVLSGSAPYQTVFISKNMNRITYDLLDRSSVAKLLETPPTIDHQTFTASVPRFIQPKYGLEVAILGLKDVLSAKGITSAPRTVTSLRIAVWLSTETRTVWFSKRGARPPVFSQIRSSLLTPV